MRAFRISLALVIAMAVLITVCTVYAFGVCGTMSDMVENLPAEVSAVSATGCRDMKAYWQEQLPRLRPITNRAIVREISDLLDILEISSVPEHGYVVDYLVARSQLEEAVGELRRTVGPGFGIWS